jgi:hypothetical protein
VTAIGDLGRSGADHLGIQCALAADLRGVRPATLQMADHRVWTEPGGDVASLLGCLAAIEDHAGGLWGASRHALTVGFVAVMVFTIGQRVLPAFCGMRVLWSKELMFWSLALLNLGCLVRGATGLRTRLSDCLETASGFRGN